MTDEEAIAFLKTVQPLPDDSELSHDLIRRYDEVRKHFIQSPNELAVPLLLNSFGNGDGLGVYQLVEDALSCVDPTTVGMHIQNALTSPHSSVRYWVAQIAANYDDQQLLSPLLHLLRDESIDTRTTALIAIEKYINNAMVGELSRLRSDEPDEEVRKLYDAILSSIH